MNEDTYWEEFSGVEPPQYTSTPDEVINGLMPRLSHVEVRVLFVIVRKTFGWGKAKDAISLSQLTKLSGASRSTVKEAVKSLEAKGIICVERGESKAGEPATNIYNLVVKGQADERPTPQADERPNKKQSYKKQKTLTNSSSVNLIRQLHKEFAPGDSLEAVQTYLGRYPDGLLQRAAEITRAMSDAKNPIAYLYGVVRNLWAAEYLKPLDRQELSELPELSEAEYAASLEALERLKESLGG